MSPSIPKFMSGYKFFAITPEHFIMMEIKSFLLMDEM